MRLDICIKKGLIRIPVLSSIFTSRGASSLAGQSFPLRPACNQEGT